jgi:5-oxoprolinase (ATP-hydrolysing)
MPVAVKPLGKVKICIDRGGTFCDVIATSESKGDHLVKLLSVDPQQYVVSSSTHIDPARVG